MRVFFGFSAVVWATSENAKKTLEEITRGNQRKREEWNDFLRASIEDPQGSANHLVLGMTKEQLVLLAREYKILKQVSEITHSCVENIRGRCGECFWGKEREWAFGEVGEVDYGTA